MVVALVSALMASVEDLAWAAGFFEGDGCVYVPPRSQGRGLRLAIGQASDDDRPPDSLTRFSAIVGCGTVTRMGPNDLSVKQRWQWRVQRREDSERVLALLRPYMTPGAKPIKPPRF